MTLWAKLFNVLLHEIMVMGWLQISFLSTRHLLSNEMMVAVLLVDSSRCWKITSDWYEGFWHRYKPCLKPITYVVTVSVKHAMSSNAGHKPVQSSMHLFNHNVFYIPEDIASSMDTQDTEACLSVTRILFVFSRLLMYSLDRIFVSGRGCSFASIYQTRFTMPRWSLIVGLALPTLSGAMPRCLGIAELHNHIIALSILSPLNSHIGINVLHKSFLTGTTANVRHSRRCRTHAGGGSFKPGDAAAGS